MNLNFRLQLELGDTAQVLAQNFALDFELVIVVSVLIVASATARKIGARRRCSMRRRLHDFDGAGADETGLLVSQAGFDLFPTQNERNEYRFALSAVVGRRWGRKAGETVAAIDQLFNGKEQDLILRHGKGT